MSKKLLNILMSGLVALVLVAGSALAEETKGTISKVGDGTITVKTKDGKDVEVKVSGKRTKLEGVKDRAELKEGQKVTVDHDGGEAKMITVK